MSETRDAEVLPAVIGTTSLTLADQGRDFAGYQGVATVSLNPDQTAALQKPMPPEALDILPTGEVYASQVHYRRLLNSVFGPGAWALVPRGAFAMQGNTVCREYALVGPGGRFISEAIGEAEYQPNNARMSYASACEAAKSNALTRCCKDIGIASECWDKRFCEQFKAEHCVQVWLQSGGKPVWRRKDAAPFWNEKGSGDRKAGEQTAPAAQTSGTPAPGVVCKFCQSDKVVQDKLGNFVCNDCAKGWKA